MGARLRPSPAGAQGCLRPACTRRRPSAAADLQRRTPPGHRSPLAESIAQSVGSVSPCTKIVLVYILAMVVAGLLERSDTIARKDMWTKRFSSGGGVRM